jgi:hypothetical protein
VKLSDRLILDGSLSHLEDLFRDMPDFGEFYVGKKTGLDLTSQPWDAEVDVRLGTKILKLRMLVTAYGQPVKVRETARVLKDSLKSEPQARGVICAPFVSKDAANVCADEGVGYVDLCGNCRIVFEGIYVVKEGKPNQYPERRDKKSLAGLFSLKASRVLKVLLRRGEKPWKLQHAADLAEVSLPLAFKVARMLEERELARGRRGKFVVEKPEDLLKLWASHYNPREHGRLQCYSMQSIQDIEEGFVSSESKQEAEENQRGLFMHEQTRAGVVLSMLRLPGALGKFSAAEYLAPIMNYNVATIYVGGDPAPFVRKMGFKAVEKGGNVELIEPMDPWFFRDLCGAHGRYVTSPAQTYLDLMQEPIRGAQAGEAILKDFRNLTERLWMGDIYA